MKKLKAPVSTRTKVKVIRAIESGIRMQSVAETMGLSPAMFIVGENTLKQTKSSYGL